MKENNENKAKALEENKKNYSSENSTPQNGEDIISNEDAEKLEGGIKHEDLERPSEGSLWWNHLLQWLMICFRSI